MIFLFLVSLIFYSFEIYALDHKGDFKRKDVILNINHPKDDVSIKYEKRQFDKFSRKMNQYIDRVSENNNDITSDLITSSGCQYALIIIAFFSVITFISKQLVH